MLAHWQWLLPGAAIFLLILIRRPALSAGKRGERKVRTGLRLGLNRQTYHLLNDVTLPFGSGTTQIDHLVVSPYGIFVIETKNISGWIFGQPHQQYWGQIIYGFRQRFRNPLLQNVVHVEAVETLLNLTEHVHNVAVFVGDCTFKTEMPRNVVYGTSELVDYVRAHQVRLFTDGEISRFVDCIETSRSRPGFWTQRAHMRYVKQVKAASMVDHDIACPRCGSAMIERANRRTGERFLGCRRFPLCRGVHSLR